MNMSNDREHLPDLEDALKAVFQTPTPTEAFVDQLEQQLLTQGATPTSREQQPRRPMMFWQRSRQLVSGAIALVALVALVAGLIALFSNTQQLTTTTGTPTPSGPVFTMKGSITEARGPIGSRQLPVSVRATLPQLPDRVPLYDIQATLDQPSPELARAWAEKLGLKSVRVYKETAGPSDLYIAQADDGQQVRMGGSQVMYQADLSAIQFPQPALSPLDPQTAKATVETFLNRMPDLFVVEGRPSAKVSIRVEPSPRQAPNSRLYGLTFEYAVLIDGIAISSRGLPNSIFVGPDGQIRSASFTPLRIKPTEQEVALRPIETVVQAFLNGDQSMLRSSGWGSIPLESEATTQQPHFRAPAYNPGESALIIGYIQHWTAVDGGSDLYLMSLMGPQSFALEGSGLDTDQSNVEVKGRIGEQIRPGLWRLKVTSIRPVEFDPTLLKDWMGVLRHQADGAWLETDSGKKYLLPDAPADMPNGERVMAQGVLIEGDTGALRLEWQLLTAETQSIQGGGVSGVVSSGEQRAVAPAPVLPNGAPASSGVFKSITSDSTGSEMTPTLPAWWTYKVGDEVTLEGELSAQAFRIRSAPASDQATPESSERIVFDAHLLVRNDSDASNSAVLIALVGDQVNVDLIRLSELQARVQGRLISSEEAAKRNPDFIGEKEFPGLALEVTHYEKIHPDEAKAVYSGKVRIETLDSKEVAVLSDTLSNREYVLADSLEFTQSLEMYRQMIENKATLSVIGVIVPDRTLADRPVVRALQSNYGSGDPAQTIQGLRDQIENPIQDYSDESGGPQDVIIDRVELIYVFQTPPVGVPAGYQPQPTELFYQLSGHSSDGQYLMTYDLTATTPTPPDVRTIEPPLVPPPTPAPTEPRTEILTYTVQAGDNLFSIAAQFNLQAEPLLWANTDTLADNPHRVQPGVVLNIMPVDGIYYRWRAGDDLTKVAVRYSAKLEDILNWPGNHLDPQSPIIEPGTMLIIPGGHPPVPPTPAPTPTPGEPVSVNPTTEPLAQPLTTEEQAIDQVLKIDANIAVWDEPWSKDTLRLEPNRITIAAFPSRTAEAAGSGEGFSPEVVADAGAVWRVTIAGTVRLSLPGIGSETTKYDGVTYVISQRHGGLLGVRTDRPIDSAAP